MYHYLSKTRMYEQFSIYFIMMYYDIIHWSLISIQLSIHTFSAAYLIQGVSSTEAVSAITGQEAEWPIYNKTNTKGQTAFHISYSSVQFRVTKSPSMHADSRRKPYYLEENSRQGERCQTYFWWPHEIRHFFSNKTMSAHMGLRSAGVSWSKEHFL